MSAVKNTSYYLVQWEENGVKKEALYTKNSYSYAIGFAEKTARENPGVTVRILKSVAHMTVDSLTPVEFE